jgi:thiamine transport system permease protein
VTALSPAAERIAVAERSHADARRTTPRIAVGAAVALALLWPLAFLAAELDREALRTAALRSSTWFTLWQAALATTIGIALALPVAWALARLDFPARRTLRALVSLPIALPALAFALGAGRLVPEGPWGLLPLVAAHAALALAIGVRLLGHAWARLDPQAAEAARVFGHTPLRTALVDDGRMLAPAIASAWSLAFALTLTAFASALLLAADGGTTLPVAVQAAVDGRMRLAEAAAAGVVLALVAAAALLVFVRCRPTGGDGSVLAERQPLRSLSGGRRAALALVAVVAALISIGPLLAVLHAAFTVGAGEQVTASNLTGLFDAARPFEVDPFSALLRSLLLASAALVIAVPIGIAAATAVAPLRGWPAISVEVALLLPLLLPVPIAAGLRAAGLAAPPWLLLVHLAIAVPLVVRGALAALRSGDRLEREAATVLGASAWDGWKRLALPRLRRHVAVAGVVAFAWSLGETGAALLLYRIDVATAPVAIVQALDARTAAADGRAYGLAAALILVVTIIFVTIEHRRSREITEF